MKKHLAAFLGLSFIAACSGEGSVASTSSGGQGGSGASGQGGSEVGGAGGTGGAGGSVSCDDFVGEAASPVTIRIVNASSSVAHLANDCEAGGPESISIDGQAVLDPVYFYTCDEVVAGQCLPPDCFGGAPVDLPPGDTYEATWNGQLAGAIVDLPEMCQLSCDFSTVLACTKRAPATAGTHSLDVDYTTDAGIAATITVEFVYPTQEIVATLTD